MAGADPPARLNTPPLAHMAAWASSLEQQVTSITDRVEADRAAAAAAAARPRPWPLRRSQIVVHDGEGVTHCA
jgi:hypothetical protein